VPPSTTRPLSTVERAVAVLDALAAEPDGLGTTEVARRVGTNASTASRLLATLASSGLVERGADERAGNRRGAAGRVGDGRWRLGMRLVELADAVLARLDVRALARDQLVALERDTGETATLSAPGDEAAVTVDFVPSRATTLSLARLGRPSLPHATAAGKVMLAFGRRGVDALGPGPYEALTERTITDPARLRAEVARTRERGWAAAAGEREAGLNALAAPVLGRHGELAGILGLQGPAGRLTEARRREVLPTLLRAAATVSRELGGAEPDSASTLAGT
jgi:DNA-binding IclR family transcriptional regulator